VDTLVQRLLTELDSLGIATQLGEKVQKRPHLTLATMLSRIPCESFLQIVGGVALTRSYYQLALETEGTPETVEQCQLVISRRVANEFKMCPYTTVTLLPYICRHLCLKQSPWDIGMRI
jgi:hypothetical protein